MKSLSPILVAFVTAVACSPSQLSTDVHRDGAGTSDVNASDAGTDDVGTDDVGTSEAGSDVGAGRQPLCDGVQRLRLSVAYVGGGQQTPGSTVKFENGYALFAVDGTCSYWIAGGWTDDAFSGELPVRTGKLSDADARVLEDALPLGDIAALGGGCSPSSIPDAPSRVIRTDTAAAICGQLPPSSPAAMGFDAAWMTVRTVAARLWEDGTPIEGALRVSAVPASAGASSRTVYAWPIALPLSGFLLDSSDWNKSGVSRLVDDPDAARSLRALRDEYLTGRAAQPGLYGDGLLTTDESITAVVHMRDAIPYEDANGLLKF